MSHQISFCDVTLLHWQNNEQYATAADQFQQERFCKYIVPTVALVAWNLATSTRARIIATRGERFFGLDRLCTTRQSSRSWRQSHEINTDNVESLLSQESPFAENARRQRCQRAKRIVEMDRLQWVVENQLSYYFFLCVANTTSTTTTNTNCGGYTVRLLELPRLGPAYPKRQLLLGAPLGTLAAVAIGRLPIEQQR